MRAAPVITRRSSPCVRHGPGGRSAVACLPLDRPERQRVRFRGGGHRPRYAARRRDDAGVRCQRRRTGRRLFRRQRVPWQNGVMTKSRPVQRWNPRPRGNQPRRPGRGIRQGIRWPERAWVWTGSGKHQGPQRPDPQELGVDLAGRQGHQRCRTDRGRRSEEWILGGCLPPDPDLRPGRGGDHLGGQSHRREDAGPGTRGSRRTVVPHADRRTAFEHPVRRIPRS